MQDGAPQPDRPPTPSQSNYPYPPPSTATSATPPPPHQSPPALHLPTATYGATPGGPGAQPPPPSMNPPNPNDLSQINPNPTNGLIPNPPPTDHQPQPQQPQQPQQPPQNQIQQQHQQPMYYPNSYTQPPYSQQYGMMPPHQYPQNGGAGLPPPPMPGAPLSPAFNNESSGPPVGTMPGTPGVNGRPSHFAPGNVGMHPSQSAMVMPVQPMMTPPGAMPMHPPPGAPLYAPPGGMYAPQPGMYSPYMSQPNMPPTTDPHPQQPTLTANGNHSSIVGNGNLPVYPGKSHNGNYSDLNPRDRMVHQEIKLEILCKGLRDRDIASKSDPTCVVFLEQRNHTPYGAYAMFYPSSAQEEFGLTNNQNNSNAGGTTHNHNSPIGDYIKWKEVGRTECIKNCLSPHFKVQITIPYHFEQLQHIRLGLWDIDSKKRDLNTHDFLGDVRTTVAELVMSGVWTQPLTSNNKKDLKTTFGGKRDLGKITVIVHENRDGGNMLIKAAASGKKLDRKDWFLSSDPYFIVSQLGKNAASRSQLYKSEVVRRSINPTWRPFQFKVAVPKGGGKEDIRLEFLVYDKDNHRRDDEIGKSTHSLQEFEKSTSVPVVNDSKKARRRSYKNSGILEFSKFEVIAMPSLVDYLQGGLKLHFSVAVDLTASNGNPNDPSSLHFQDYYGNRYTRAIYAIANVLRVYCATDNMFAAFGFGAELPASKGYTSSCFPLNLGQDPLVHGVEGVIQAYSRALSVVRLSGPTNFAPLIETVSRTAAQRINTQTDQNYDVLLILTDGVVSDYELTVDRIISASKTSPLSIIIIGIGNRNFRKMKELDSDDILLTSADGTRQAVRDICQFVDFSEYEQSPPERLGAAVLAELPGNIVEYFVGICNPAIHPGDRPERHISSIS